MEMNMEMEMEMDQEQEQTYDDKLQSLILMPGLVYVPDFVFESVNDSVNDTDATCNYIPFNTDYKLGDSILHFNTFNTFNTPREPITKEDKPVILHNSSFTELELNLPIKEINNIIKLNCLTKEEEELIKYERRKFFNRYYARVARFKRKQKKINNSTVGF